jgi:enhancing lycopene biosynthesis protein 2
MKKNRRFAVVLSGCGVFDGSEIHEATMTLYAIMKNDGIYEIFAPDVPQHHVINHITGEAMEESRNVLVESARIARGKIKALTEFSAEDFDFLIFPGGYGVAKNLSNFAFEGADCKVNIQVEKVVRDMVRQDKPVGALCIAPVLMARIMNQPELTIGDDPETMQALEKMGSRHKITGHGEIVVDKNYKLVTSPCYMLDASILDIAEGADAVVKQLIKLT